MMDFKNYLNRFVLEESKDLFNNGKRTSIEFIEILNKSYPKFINEFWTSKQRQANSLHEIAYRACFKGQLPSFFISNLTKPQDIVYDPFSGRGTTIIEAALFNRNVIANDINPLSEILCRPRLFIPSINDLKNRLYSIGDNRKLKSDIDLSMFFHEDTLIEILSIKKYLDKRTNTKEKDEIDSWIRMVATNRLTGHSKGYFSVYTLPPNQAVSPESQIKINIKRNQEPEYRNVREIIIKKSINLIKDISDEQKLALRKIYKNAKFLSSDARETNSIQNNSIQLTVTSPPFLDIVQYASDNWLRCWFNNIAAKKIEKRITMSKKIEDWCSVMAEVFNELYRITKKGGWVAFEVGEVRDGKIKLDEYVIPLGVKAGFVCEGVVINSQEFTKTSSIWGISNNKKGTNTNRIVLFNKY